MRQVQGLAILAFLFGGFATCADWNQFRGPLANASAEGVSIPDEWGPDRNIRWSIPLAGVGYSSPVISGGKVFLTTCLEPTGERLLVCHDLETGKELWKQGVVKAPLETRHQLSSCANSTPLATSDRVYCSFLDKDRYLLAAYDHGGKEKWRRDLGAYVNKHGFCSSPMLQDGNLLIAADNDASGFVAAINPATGETVWRHERTNSVRSFSVPVPGTDKRQVLVAGCRGLTSLDSQTGKVQWRVETPTEKFVAAPAVCSGIALISGSSPENTLWGVNIKEGGKVEWKESANSLYTCSPVVANGLVFGVTDQGVAWCLDPATGKRHWTERLGKAHHASLLAVNHTVLAFDQSGACHVIEASSRFRKTRTNKLPGEIHATPALLADGLVIRTTDSLIRIGIQKPSQKIH